MKNDAREDKSVRHGTSRATYIIEKAKTGRGVCNKFGSKRKNYADKRCPKDSPTVAKTVEHHPNAHTNSLYLGRLHSTT